MKRLFVALPLNNTIREHITEFSTALQKIDLDGNFVAPENIHLTLKFLGNVEEKRIPEICELIENTLLTFSKFSTQIKNVGVFPSIDRIQTVWIGVESNDMLKLTKTIQTALNSIRPEEHQDIIPHLTILRVKSGKGKPQLQAAIGKWSRNEFGTLFVDKVVLYESILTPTGPKYIFLKEFKLK